MADEAIRGEWYGMPRSPLILSVLWLALAAACPAQVLRVFILTGQSNSLGTLGTTDTTMRLAPVGSHPAEQAGGVPFFWDNRADGTAAGDAALGASGGWVTLGPQTGGHYAGNDDHWGPEIGFARLLWNAGHRGFGLIKASRGGGGNTFWSKGSADDHMYRHVLATVQAAAASLPAGYTSMEVAGLLFVQGESNNSTEAAEAGTRFAALMANLRADLAGASGMKGICGEIAGSGTDRDTTRANQSALAQSSAEVGYARSTGLAVHNQDGLGLHYDADSQILLGERMAAEAIGAGCLPTTPLPAWPQLHAWFVGDNGSMPDATSAITRWAALHDGAATRDLTRRVAGQTFRYAVTAFGQPRQILRFDGTNDLWASAAEFGTLSGARTVAFLCRVTGSGDGFLFDGSTSTGRTRAQVRAGQWQAGTTPSGTGTVWNGSEGTTAARQPGTWQHHVFVFAPANGGADTAVTHWVDGVQAATLVDPDVASLAGFIVGSNGGSPFTRLAVDVAEAAVFAKALEPSEIAALESAWDSRWGTPGGPPFGVTVSQSARTVARFGWHDVLGLRIDADAEGTTLTQLRLRLGEGTRPALSRLAVFGTGTSSSFRPGPAPLALLAAPATDEVTLDLSLPLAEGTNHLWIALEPQRRAPLGSSLDASLAELTFTGSHAGTLVPAGGNPDGALTLGLVPLITDIRRSGDEGVATYRIPGLASSPDGTLHAVYDIRYAGGGDLPANIDVGYSRSSDGGATWSPMQRILDFDASVAGSSGNGVGDPSILVDPSNGAIWVAALWSFGDNAYNGSRGGTDPSVSGQYVLTRSDDNGQTWSPPINITAAVKDNVDWWLVFQGPGHGLVLHDGTLVFPSQYRDTAGVVRSCSVFSTDHGATWDFGSGVPVSSPQTNENTACQLDDGRLLFSMRTPSGSNGQRAWIHYQPGGTTPMRDGIWSPLFRLAAVPDPVCQGSVITWKSRLRGHPREWVLFGNPASSSSRINFTLRVSPDGGQTWPVARLLYPGSAAYSSLAILPDQSIAVFLETDNYTRMTFLRVEEGWLLAGAGDADADGLPDAWESLMGLNPSADDSAADPDGDGATNRQEHDAGTDPLDRNSVFRSLGHSAVEGGVNFRWASVPGRAYRIQSSPDLSEWEDADPPGTVTAASSECAAELPVEAVAPRAFVRVLLVR